jgi:hypothetical protein
MVARNDVSVKFLVEARFHSFTRKFERLAVLKFVFCVSLSCERYAQGKIRNRRFRNQPVTYVHARKILNLSKFYKSTNYKRKNAQVVTNLQQTCSNAVPTTCQQDVFALLVPSLLTSCQRLVDDLLQGCWSQQTCYKLFQQLVIVVQFNNLSTCCEWQPCSNLIK